jgi:AraC-like DNA-binding protein
MAINDVLSDVFATLRLHGGVYFRAELSGAWAIEIPAERRRIRFHLVRHGTCWAKVRADPDPIRLMEGDVAIIPNGAAQILSDRPGRKPVKLSDIVESGAIDPSGVLSYGAGAGDDGGEPGGRVRLLCGFCDFDEDVEHPVVTSLPALMVLSARDLGAEPWVAETLRLMSLEADLAGQGMDGILGRLLEVVFIQLVRRLSATAAGAELGYISALADPRLSKALLAIHGTPQRPWTIAELAKTCGLSRAVFAEKFTSAVGVPPIRYLTNWRLMKARRLLRETDLGIDEIARRCGYQSLPSFTRRFKAAFDIGPGAFRRSLQRR